MTPRKETIALLESNGFTFARHGGSHDIYFNAETKTTIPVKRHDFDEKDMRYILKEAKIDRRRGKK